MGYNWRFSAERLTVLYNLFSASVMRVLLFLGSDSAS